MILPKVMLLCYPLAVFFATYEDMSFALKMPGGCCTCMYGGEGLVVAINGPGAVFSQNRNPSLWKTILQREGVKKKGQGAGGQS